ncbi:MAG: transposase [Candidatus Binatia bacterium]
MKCTIGIPKLAVIDGGAGLPGALQEQWKGIEIQRCTAHKFRNLLSKAPARIREELAEDYRRMIYADDAKEVDKQRAKFRKKSQLKCAAVQASREEAGDELFTFTKFPQSQWNAARAAHG